MDQQNHTYKNRIEGDIEIPLKEPLTFEQLDKLDKRKYLFRYVIVGLSFIALMAIIIYGSAKTQWISAGIGTLIGAIRGTLKIILSTRSP